MKTYLFKSLFGDEEEIYFKVVNYYNGNLCLQAYCKDGEPFETFSTNFEENLPPYFFYVNNSGINNLVKFLVENNIAKIKKGYIRYSGFNEYQLCKLTNEFIKENNL